MNILILIDLIQKPQAVFGVWLFLFVQATSVAYSNFKLGD